MLILFKYSLLIHTINNVYAPYNLCNLILILIIILILIYCIISYSLGPISPCHLFLLIQLFDHYSVNPFILSFSIHIYVYNLLSYLSFNALYLLSNSYTFI